MEFDIRFESVLVEDGQNLALLDLIAFFESHFLDAAGDSKSQIDLANIHIPINHQLIGLLLANSGIRPILLLPTGALR